MNDPQQESRTERVALAVTPSEKRAIVELVRAKATNQSELCRTTTISDIVAEAQRLRSVGRAA